MTVKLLAEHHLEFLSLKGGCRGWSESTHVKMSNCWKYHAAAHYAIFWSNSVIGIWAGFDKFKDTHLTSNLKSNNKVIVCNKLSLSFSQYFLTSKEDCRREFPLILSAIGV